MTSQPARFALHEVHPDRFGAPVLGLLARRVRRFAQPREGAFYGAAEPTEVGRGLPSERSLERTRPALARGAGTPSLISLLMSRLPSCFFHPLSGKYTSVIISASFPSGPTLT